MNRLKSEAGTNTAVLVLIAGVGPVGRAKGEFHGGDVTFVLRRRPVEAAILLRKSCASSGADSLVQTEVICDVGIGVVPEDGIVLSPFDGTVTSVFDTKHAVTLEKDGMEVLIHVGVNTVNM
ncbi:MAG: PTS glucose transporter subunit IIA, partial [Bacteroidales bacterium]|nr:PTS glucose transporter subunit IIA [Bacteroidales bacterium]